MAWIVSWSRLMWCAESREMNFEYMLTDRSLRSGACVSHWASITAISEYTLGLGVRRVAERIDGQPELEVVQNLVSPVSNMLEMTAHSVPTFHFFIKSRRYGRAISSDRNSARVLRMRVSAFPAACSRSVHAYIHVMICYYVVRDNTLTLVYSSGRSGQPKTNPHPGGRSPAGRIDARYVSMAACSSIGVIVIGPSAR